MRVLIWIAGALVGLAALVFLAGWMMPATREGRAELVIAAPPEAVLAVLQDVEAQAEWRPEIESVQRSGDGWIEVTTSGERISLFVEEMTLERVRFRFISRWGYSGEWEAVLEPVEGGTRIAVVERATVPSAFGRVISRLMFDPEEFAATYLAALKARVEG
ncbi:SRPBCC family protein [Tabrizicola sp.]|uniref:SRPBCC family protein n=1 Tax=Tabrizicola sp. TaxID=2005166 RepID=UPI003F3C028B